MTEEVREKPKRQAGCLGRLGRTALYGFVLLAVFLAWLNGPGMRWLGPKVAAHFMAKAGMRGDMRLGGTLLGGVEVYDLEITSAEGALERLEVDKLVTDYRFSEVISGKLRGISGSGIHADIRVVDAEEEKKPPLDLTALVKSLREARGKVLPVKLDLKDVSFAVKKDGARVVELEGSDFSHKVGDASIGLSLGRIIDASGRFTQRQKTALVWEEDGLMLRKLDLLPSIGVRNLAVALPQSGMLSAEAMIRLGGAVLRLDVGEGIRDVRLDLTEGELDFANLLPGFGLVSPVKGRLTSLALEVKNVFPEWQAAVGTAEVFIEGFSYDDWKVPELSAGVTLGEGELFAKLTGKSLGSDFTIEGGGKFERAVVRENGFVMDEIGGDLRVEKLGEVLRGLDAKFEMGGRFKEFPDSAVAGKWSVDLDSGMPAEVAVDLTAKAVDEEVSTVRLDAAYAGKVVTLRSLETTGRKISGSFDTETRSYVLRESMNGFQTESIAPWLKGAGMEVPGTGVFSLEWEGSGNLLTNSHKGEMREFSGTWQGAEEARPPMTASGRLRYDWPGSLEVEGLAIETAGQTLRLDAEMKDNQLTLGKFTWLEGEQELAGGHGTLPVPENFTKWKEFLANDTRPLDLMMKSQVLPLAKLRPWMKGLELLDEKATGKIDLKIVGSLADPEVNGLIEIRNVGVPERSEIPRTDVTVNVRAHSGRAEISAEAVAADYAPAVFKAEMAFLPKKWADQPEILMEEEIKGTLDLPRVELSRFQPLVPGAEELGGVTTGKVVIGGTLREPKVDGELKLSSGKLRMKGGNIPELRGVDFEMNADLKTLRIKGGVADIAGGNLKISGSILLSNAAGDGLGALDFSVKGTGLPLVRNDFLIMRANADLKVAGEITDAKISGEIGIIDSVFYKDMDLIPIGKPFLAPSAASLPKVDAPENLGTSVPAPFESWTTNIVVKTIDPILLRGNLGTGRVDVALRIEGKLGDPKPNGKVRLADVAARLPFSTLQIREGYLNFSPETGFDPVLEIRGSAEPRPYRVEAYVHGRASDPQLVLTSQPPLPETEIMTLLATGTTSAGLEDSQAASSRAMQLLIEEMRRGRFLFGKQLRPVLGLLDNVDFSLAESDPYDSDSFSSATLKLSEKWFVSAGIGADGGQRFIAIWRFRFR